MSSNLSLIFLVLLSAIFFSDCNTDDDCEYNNVCSNGYCGKGINLKSLNVISICNLKMLKNYRKKISITIFL